MKFTALTLLAQAVLADAKVEDKNLRLRNHRQYDGSLQAEAARRLSDFDKEDVVGPKEDARVLQDMSMMPEPKYLELGEGCLGYLNGPKCAAGLICQSPKKPGIDVNSCAPGDCTCKVREVGIMPVKEGEGEVGMMPVKELPMGAILCEGQPTDNYCDCESDCFLNEAWCGCEEAMECCLYAEMPKEEEHPHKGKGCHHVCTHIATKCESHGVSEEECEEKIRECNLACDGEPPEGEVGIMPVKEEKGEVGIMPVEKEGSWTKPGGK